MVAESTDSFVGTWERSTPKERLVAQLVLVWSMDEPKRLGESLIIEAPSTVGRGLPLDDDAAPRVYPSRVRPGAVAATTPIANARISRQQLTLTPLTDERLKVKNVGRAPLRINGVVATEGVVGEGDVLEVQNAATWLVRFSSVRTRPAAFPAFPFGEPDPFGLVGESPAAWALREGLAFAAGTDRHVLLLGESGTGKELAARSLHGLSSRRGRALVARNAATLPEGLIDAELFGNVKNYPNPGMPERAGLIGEADGGTLFLDEIGDLPEKSQVHLLRVLDAGGEYQRLGEARTRQSSFRLVAATNRPLSSLKHDFLARFTHRVRVPSFDERREDVPLIFDAMLRRVAASNPSVAQRFFARRLGELAEPRVSPSLIARLVRHRYTHHARELDRLMWLAIQTAPDDFLGVTPALDEELSPEVSSTPAADPAGLDAATLSRAMEEAQNSPTRAARALGLKNRYVLIRLLKKHGLSTGDGDDA
ncbi:MAG: sigma 54-interacting transcriptional regulator [Myxococcota bacterium]